MEKLANIGMFEGLQNQSGGFNMGVSVANDSVMASIFNLDPNYGLEEYADSPAAAYKKTQGNSIYGSTPGHYSYGFGNADIYMFHLINDLIPEARMWLGLPTQPEIDLGDGTRIRLVPSRDRVGHKDKNRWYVKIIRQPTNGQPVIPELNRDWEDLSADQVVDMFKKIAKAMPDSQRYSRDAGFPSRTPRDSAKINAPFPPSSNDFENSMEYMYRQLHSRCPDALFEVNSVSPYSPAYVDEAMCMYCPNGYKLLCVCHGCCTVGDGKSGYDKYEVQVVGHPFKKGDPVRPIKPVLIKKNLTMEEAMRLMLNIANE